MILFTLCLGPMAPSAFASAQAPEAQLPPIQAPELPPSVDAVDRLSLAQAVTLGLQQNPQIAAAKYQIQSALANYKSQAAPLNPSIAYAALNNTVAPLSWNNGFGVGSNYSAYATLETNGAIHYRTGQAREQYRQAQFDAATTGLSLKLSIVSAYTSLQVANQALEVEMKVYGSIVTLSDLTEKRYASGAGPQSDATRARIAAIQEQQNVITDVANVNSARAALNMQLGRRQDQPIDALEPLTYRTIPTGDLPSLTKAAEQTRPELRAAVANLRSLEETVGLERSAYFPNVELGKDFGDDGQIFIGMSIPLDLGSIRGAVAKAAADARAQREQVEVQRQSIDLDVRSSYINLISAQKQVDSYETGILKLSEALVDQVRQGYTLGANTIVDVVTAENTYRSVESAYYQAVGAYLQAAYTLKHSIGDLADSGSDLSLTSIGPRLSAAPTPMPKEEKS